ncbi:ATP-binding cassette domain-containing protein [Pseudorhizobium flavum]|jgi:thiamine transport system ATP-binding protein|uniref:thiamine ABC transporter ATP-binding protein n=1 Tax=Pseudorhizobium flavum TaxID=1335061 RepID=UPI00248F6C36|nr:ATP-binding cassette domain-containing protein [Pseudorhizobium flavum]
MPADDDAPEIRLDRVDLTLGNTRFLLDCDIPPGAITAVAGPSGAGKSTLLNLVAGFEVPDSGRVLFNGQDLTSRHPSERPVSLIFQNNNLFGHLDVFTNVALGINPSLRRLTVGERQAVVSALDRVGLGGMERRLPSTLSGGEQQRVAFARALVREKPVLLMDEPFAALDPGLRQTMASLLSELHRETKSTIILVTHDREELRRLASHVIFMEGGNVLVNAPVEDFLRRRDIPAVVQFLAS